MTADIQECVGKAAAASAASAAASASASAVGICKLHTTLPHASTTKTLELHSSVYFLESSFHAKQVHCYKLLSPNLLVVALKRRK